MNKQNWLGLALQILQLILSTLLKKSGQAMAFMLGRR